MNRIVYFFVAVMWICSACLTPSALAQRTDFFIDHAAEIKLTQDDTSAKFTLINHGIKDRVFEFYTISKNPLKINLVLEDTPSKAVLTKTANANPYVSVPVNQTASVTATFSIPPAKINDHLYVSVLDKPGGTTEEIISVPFSYQPQQSLNYFTPVWPLFIAVPFFTVLIAGLIAFVKIITATTGDNIKAKLRYATRITPDIKMEAAEFNISTSWISNITVIVTLASALTGVANTGITSDQAKNIVGLAAVLTALLALAPLVYRFFCSNAWGDRDLN